MELKDIRAIIENVFNLEKGSVTDETTSADIEKWDSLGQFSLIDYLDTKHNDITKKKPDLAIASSVKELYDFGLKDL